MCDEEDKEDKEDEKDKDIKDSLEEWMNEKLQPNERGYISHERSSSVPSSDSDSSDSDSDD